MPPGPPVFVHFLLLFRFDLGADLICFQTDPLSALLTKYVPAEQRPRRDVAGEYAGRDVHEMVVSCLRKVSSILSIRRISTLPSIPRILSPYLHLSHKHSHYSSVSRIWTHSCVILLSLSVLFAVRSTRPRFLLYPPSVARYF